jgi:hypothetical protein
MKVSKVGLQVSQSTEATASSDQSQDQLPPFSARLGTRYEANGQQWYHIDNYGGFNDAIVYVVLRPQYHWQ